MTKKYKILVVDDDLKNIQVGINFLKKNEDYHLVFATSGEQALERVKETDFDLILLDIIMPVMDGYEVCRKLKSNEKTKNIPIIFLTAKHEADSLMKGFEVGGSDYITKPFSAPELNARVKTHLELHYQYKQELAKLHQILRCSQKAETVKFIASGIAHDCNNFMISIPGNLLRLQKRMSKNNVPENGYKDLFDGIETAVKQVSGLLDRLFSFSAKDRTNTEVVNMSDVVTDLSKVYRGHANHNISFEIDFLSQQALTVADKLRIEQVLLNMLVNAQHAILARNERFAEKGFIRLAIDKCGGNAYQELTDGVNYLKISIEDNGIGIPEEMLGKIFDPYFSTHADDGGSGLGLAISLDIVQSYHGAIEVLSETNKGTRFNVYLPEHNGSTL